MIAPDIALAEGLDTITRCATHFYDTNASHLRTIGIDLQDLCQHIVGKVLVAKYLPLLHGNPTYYENSERGEVESFRASVFAASRRCFFAFHRGQVRSQKRGLGLKNGYVHLDNPDTQADAALMTSAIGLGTTNMETIHKLVSDALPSLHYKRVWSLLVLENPKAIKRLYPDANERDSVVKTIRTIAYQTLNFTEDSFMTNKDAIKKMVESARQRGLIVHQEEKVTDHLFGTVVDKLRAANPERLQQIYQYLHEEDTVLVRDRHSRILENTQAILDTDYEILSDTFKVEVNSEMSAAVVVGVLNFRIESMTDTEKEEIPSYVWDIIKALRELVQDEIPKTPTIATLKDKNYSFSTKKIGDKEFSIEVSGLKTEEFFVILSSSERFQAWSQSTEAKIWIQAGVMFVSGDKESLSVSADFLKSVLSSMISQDGLKKTRPRVKATRSVRPSKPKVITAIQQLCLEALTTETMPLSKLATVIGKPIAAANSVMESLRRAGKVTSHLDDCGGKSKVTVWGLC